MDRGPPRSIYIRSNYITALGRRKDKSDPVKYKLYSKEGSTDSSELITSENWIRTLREHSGSELLDLWMERELPPIEITPHSGNHNSISAANQAKDDSLTQNAQVPDDTSRTLTATRTSSTQLGVPVHQRELSRSSGHSSVISRATTRQLSDYKSFLRWPLEEDRKNPPGRTPDQRVNLWLEYILNSILRSHHEDLTDDTQAQPSASLGPQQQTSANSSPYPISTLSQTKVRDLLKRSRDPAPPSLVPLEDGRPGTVSPDPTPQAPGNTVQETQPVREVDQVFAKAQHLLALFVPGIVRSSDPTDESFNTADHRAVQIYWGLVGRIIEVSPDPLSAFKKTNSC